MRYPYNDSSVRLVGRWGISDSGVAETSTTGAYGEISFSGNLLTLHFDVKSNRYPYPHLWIELDGGARFEVPLDAYIKVQTNDDSGKEHICRFILKSSVEAFGRWYKPLVSKLSFAGYEAGKSGTLPPDDRKTIEFVGDSITEGVLIDPDYFGDGTPEDGDIDQFNRVYQDDVCATYAWLCAEKFNLKPIFMGYGAVGATKGGQGKVPEAALSYPYNFDGSPITHKNSDYILINHGANDRSKPIGLYLSKYEKMLDVIRAHNPESKLICLSAFVGYAHKELGEFIAEYNERHGCDISYIDSEGWVPPSPLHPDRRGHLVIFGKLCEKLATIINN